MFVTLQDGVAFLQEPGHAVDDAGGVAAVDRLDPREPVVSLVDVQEGAGRDQSALDRRPEEDVWAVLVIDAVQVEDILLKAAEDEPVRQAVDRLPAPADGAAPAAEGRRRRDAEVRDVLLHVIEVVAQPDASPLVLQFVPEIFDSH